MITFLRKIDNLLHLRHEVVTNQRLNAWVDGKPAVAYFAVIRSFSWRRFRMESSAPFATFEVAPPMGSNVVISTPMEQFSDTVMDMRMVDTHE